MTSLNPHIDSKANRRFRRLALNTVITLYLLIIAGGVVRSTGAGMGCPDWPKCFGRWVPPTEASQLPANYKELYGTKLKGEVVFNPVKTWTEYVNRLLGAFTGVMIFFTLLASIPFLRSGNKQIFFFSLAAFLLTGFQGWLGAKVVSFELLPVIVTLHMLLAIVIVLMLLYLYSWAGFSSNQPADFQGRNRNLNRLSLIVMTLSLIQILLGTQVRENMDEVIAALGYGARSEWIEELGVKFYVHRSFSILIFVMNILWARRMREVSGSGSIFGKVAAGVIGVMLIEIVTGVVMAYFGVPPFAQPLHLTLAILMIGLQFVGWLVLNRNRFLVYQGKPA